MTRREILCNQRIEKMKSQAKCLPCVVRKMIRDENRIHARNNQG